ncbi:unnamed protein product [Sphenostylis stenocarpa]|uniref:Uncharacterized protein n=1 Tax=Sphenostylis stenocarpa TaxID=92480 RepID=A0AA86S8Y3_9FABA|nr:unnamed protein product [Sphenostylis stenocarpa]
MVGPTTRSFYDMTKTGVTEPYGESHTFANNAMSSPIILSMFSSDPHRKRHSKVIHQFKEGFSLD